MTRVINRPDADRHLWAVLDPAQHCHSVGGTAWIRYDPHIGKRVQHQVTTQPGAGPEHLDERAGQVTPPSATFPRRLSLGRQKRTARAAAVLADPSGALVLRHRRGRISGTHALNPVLTAEICNVFTGAMPHMRT